MRRAKSFEVVRHRQTQPLFEIPKPQSGVEQSFRRVAAMASILRDDGLLLLLRPFREPSIGSIDAATHRAARIRSIVRSFGAMPRGAPRSRSSSPWKPDRDHSPTSSDRDRPWCRGRACREPWTTPLASRHARARRAERRLRPRPFAKAPGFQPARRRQALRSAARRESAAPTVMKTLRRRRTER